MLTCIVQLVISKGIQETCNVDGSGADDGDESNCCCKQSECDAIFNPTNNPDKRCCTEVEREMIPKPIDCTLCTVCCDETERRKKPIPDHCSNCPRCEGKVNIIYDTLSKKTR